MPLYVYRCNSCEDKFEIFHLMSEEIFNCQHCQSENIERIPQVISKPIQKASKVTGDLVKKFIEDTKKDVQEQRKEAKQGMDI